jgi:hypothetical protein
VSVFGKVGDRDATIRAAFQAALKGAGQVGLVFGGGCFFGHGVNVTGGAAKFVLINYSIF